MRWPWKKKKELMVWDEAWSGEEIESFNSHEDADRHWVPEEIHQPTSHYRPAMPVFDIHRYPPTPRTITELEAENDDLLSVMQAASAVIFWRSHPDVLKEKLDALRDAIVTFSDAAVAQIDLDDAEEPPAAPTGSVEAGILASYMDITGFEPTRHQRQFLDGFMFSNPPLGDFTELKRFAEEQGKEWTSPALQTEFMVAHFGAEGGWMPTIDPKYAEASNKVQENGQDQGTDPQQGLEFLQKKIEERE